MQWRAVANSRSGKFPAALHDTLLTALAMTETRVVPQVNLDMDRRRFSCFLGTKRKDHNGTARRESSLSSESKARIRVGIHLISTTILGPSLTPDEAWCLR